MYNNSAQSQFDKFHIINTHTQQQATDNNILLASDWHIAFKIIKFPLAAVSAGGLFVFQNSPIFMQNIFQECVIVMHIKTVH